MCRILGRQHPGGQQKLFCIFSPVQPDRPSLARRKVSLKVATFLASFPPYRDLQSEWPDCFAGFARGGCTFGRNRSHPAPRRAPHSEWCNELYSPAFAPSRPSTECLVPDYAMVIPGRERRRVCGGRGGEGGSRGECRQVREVAEAPRQLALRRPRLADAILAFSKHLQALYFPCTFRVCNSARSRKSCD